MPRRLHHILLGVLLLAALAVAQPGHVRAEAELRGRCVAVLSRLAATALRHQVGTRAKEAYDEILAHYDPDHASTRRALGFKRTRRGWRPVATALHWADTADDLGRYKTALAWRKARLQLAALHRARGLLLIGDSPAVARRHLERAIRFDPRDAEAHRRLGHELLVVDGEMYFGGPAERAFIRTMRQLERQALALARQEIAVRPVGELPRVLAVHDQKMFGARSEHFVVFAPGTQQNADNCARWAERGRAFLHQLLGAERAARLGVDRRHQWFAWRAFVWTGHQRDRLIAANLRRNADSEFARYAKSAAAREVGEHFGNLTWTVDGKHRELTTQLTPAAMHDRLVSHVWELGIATADADYRPNWPLAQGALHAATWYLLATATTKVGGLPEGTAARRAFELPEGVAWWLRAMRDAAIAGTDMPIREVARQTSAAFSNAARLKSWSFMTWLMAREPKRWLEFVLAVPGAKVPFPEEVEAAARKVFGRALAEVEAEWREWAAGRSVTAAATGYAPPQLPSAPSPAQRAGLERLNFYRRAAGLPPCQLDQEAALACADHARYLARHRDQWSWPAAHEQDPSRAGFTPRGMRCGQRSVIVWQARDPEHAIDEWIGTVYHRFPLLAQDVRRVGIAFEADICVLDTGSLAEPHAVDADGNPTARKWVQWPPDGAKGVQRQFAFYELPNPLGDVPPPHNRDDQAGYPVSLTLAHYLHPRIESADIHLYAVKKRGREFVREREVRLHVHTPGKPLLARQEVQDTVFGIPYRPLAPRTTYQAVVTLRTAAATETVEWLFTTGAMALRKAGKPR